VRERRLRPQAGCHVQPFNATPVNAPRLFGCATEADLAWVGQLQAPKVRLSCTDQKYVCNRAMRKKKNELVNSVDKGFGHGRSYGSRGTRVRPSLYDVTTRVTYTTCFRHAASGSQSSAFGRLPDDNSYAA
jgi:hypothetical protein